MSAPVLLVLFAINALILPAFQCKFHYVLHAVIFGITNDKPSTQHCSIPYESEFKSHFSN